MYKNALLLAFALIISLGAAEVICRLNGKYAGYLERTRVGKEKKYVSPYNNGWETWYHTNKPYHQQTYNLNEFNIEWRVNNEGLRDIDFVEGTDSVKRVMVLGDSFTEGFGAVNDSTYPRQLGLLLHNNGLKNTQVMNCGVSGSDPVYKYRLFNDRLVKYKPTLLILTLNDVAIAQTITRGGFKRFTKANTITYNKPPWFEPVYAKSFLVRRVLHDVLRFNSQLISPFKKKQVEDLAVAEVNTAIDSIYATCKANNIKMLVVFHPVQGEYRNQSEHSTQAIEEHCQVLNLPVVNTRKEFEGLGINTTNFETLYWHNDTHFNATGYNYLARSVLPATIKLLN
ncbi:MAG TPA: SGNH/GDSL hydrolase family protein [Ferruginibacter sp.]|nr:SGNH/GDSL hydrolase family protein [Ferruginibacter sp.]